MSKDNNITRKQALKHMGGLALGGTGLFSSLAATPKNSDSSFPNVITNRASARPNVLWITGEGVPISVLSSYQDTRWGDLRSSLVDTPNIDRIAREGMQLNNSFCTNALCAPGRATILTGKYSHENGVPGNGRNNFKASQQTFPKVMQKHGYQTATMGKWHLHRHKGGPVNPAKVGFDKFVFKAGAGTRYYNPHGYLQNPKIGSTTIEKANYKGYNTDVFTNLGIQTMKDFSSSEKPFLMMIQFFNDHEAWEPPHKYEDLYDGQRIPEPSTFWDDFKHRSSAAENANMRIENIPNVDWNPPDDLTLRQLKQYNYQVLMKRFLGALKAQDDNIGRLLDYLDQSGLADNTIVVYTCDHGYFLGEHGWYDKRFMYEPSIRVPWMIRYPGTVKPQSTSDLMNINIDNAPTVLDLVNLPIPNDMQGRSLMPILQGYSPDDWRTSMYYHYYEDGRGHAVQPHYGVRTEDYKLINYYTIDEWELFDLKKDPDEMESLFKWNGYGIYSGYEKIAHNLVKELKQLRKKYHDNTGRRVRSVPTKAHNWG